MFATSFILLLRAQAVQGRASAPTDGEDGRDSAGRGPRVNLPWTRQLPLSLSLERP